MFSDIQFYPTPKHLAIKAWAKFKNQEFTKVLEPHAGFGDLALACPGEDYYHRRRVNVDCCEIDVTKHAILREKGLKVVGMDFLQMRSASSYSHILMNPPFFNGDKHLLKAFDILWDGEIVAILNAETIRNPYSAERQRLVRLIEQHGEVEFIKGAFTVQEAERKTAVDVALIYLKKEADISADIIGPILTELEADSLRDTISEGFKEAQELAIPNTVIENSVIAFNAAVSAMREAVFKDARARYYASLLGQAMSVSNGDLPQTDDRFSVAYVRDAIAERYDDLKDRAWTNILRGSKVTSKLSSKAQKRVEAEFETIKQMEFSVLNVLGFLCGIVDSQQDIQKEMVLDVFDQISKYHADNVFWVKGWKSNSKHRTCGYSIKTTRFILPGNSIFSFSTGFRFETEQMLRDFDKVFSLLDGKAAPEEMIHENSLVAVSHRNFDELRRGKRISSNYFDIRFYPGAGTIHFFPRSKTLIGRLNRMVGKWRKWLPEDDAHANAAYWDYYDKAERFDKEFRAEIDAKYRHTHHWNHPLHLASRDEGEKTDDAHKAIDEVLNLILEKNGIDISLMLEDKKPRGQLLLETV